MDAGLFELEYCQNIFFLIQRTHKISDRIDVFPLPEAPMRRTWIAGNHEEQILDRHSIPFSSFRNTVLCRGGGR